MQSFNQFDVKITRGLNETLSLHPEVELLFVVDGSAEVTIHNTACRLVKEDIVLINSSVNHSVEANPDSVILSIRYDYQVLVHVLKKPNSFFMCNSASDSVGSYTRLRSLIWELLRLEIVDQHKTDSAKYSILYQILDELVEQFMVDDSSREISDNYDADEKLQEIIHYVHRNYQDGISLSELAKEMYTSTSTLSRLFKKQTGTYFAEYVNQVRIHYAVNELLYTEKNMTKIAMDCGFSNASAFTKIFRETYNMAPTEYRQKIKAEGGNVSEDEASLKEALRKDLTIEPGFQLTQLKEQKAEKLHLNMRNSEPYRQIWRDVLNCGFMHNLQQANVQFHLQFLVQELKFKYVRIWSVFDSKLQMSDGVTLGNYNFDSAFDIFDFLLSIHVKPWLEFTNRPDAIVRDDGDTLKFENNGIEFKNKKIWEDMFSFFMKEIVRRYGAEEVNSWVFEFGRELFHEDYDHFYDDPTYSVVNVFTFACSTIREYAPEARIGFSAAATNVAEKKLIDSLKLCREAGWSPDFVSCMLFPYQPIMGEDREIKGSFVRSTDWYFEKNEALHCRSVLEQAGLSNTPIVVSEWNLTVSTRNLLNDSCFRSACFCKKIADLSGIVDTVGCWTATDWLCSSFDTRNLLNGGSGMVTKDGICKPIYYALQFLNHLGDRMIEAGECYIATRSAKDEYHVLFFNPSWYSSSYFLKSERQMNPYEIESVFESCEAKHLDVELEGLSSNSRYYIKKRTVSREHGSVLDEWHKLGFDDRLERADIKYLKDISVPGLFMETVTTTEDKLNLHVELSAQEICTYHIFPAD